MKAYLYLTSTRWKPLFSTLGNSVRWIYVYIYIYMDGAKKRREKPCFLAPRSVTSIRLTLSHFLYYLLFEAYRDEMNAIWYQKRKEFHNGVHTVRYKGAWLLVLSPFLSLSFPFYSTFLKIVVWLLCSSLSLSLSPSPSFVPFYWNLDRVVCLRRNRSNSISELPDIV